MSSPLFILGTGGHARDLADIVAAIKRRPVFVTRDRTIIEQWQGADEIVNEAAIVQRSGLDYALGVGSNQLRRRIAERYAHLSFPALIHPDSSFGRDQRAVVVASRGTCVFAGVRLGSRIDVGQFCTFNLNSTVSHDCELSAYVNLAPGANVAGNVRIGEGAWIGMGAAINQGNDARKLAIGAGTVIGSGAVVLDDCDEGSTYAGVPARKLR